jgi:serine/threonine protein kinase
VETGKLLGKYELLEELGSGSMGYVYRARDRVLDREVALKVMRTGPHIEPELRERFYREARAGARLHHPNIVMVYDLGESEGSSYISMELLEGFDWRTAVKAKWPIPLATRIDLMAQVCEGLAHAHRHGIIHRDIKPSNLFIHSEHRAKILDFGVARLTTSMLTKTGKVLGTINYMAPEQMRGQRCDERSDLFSAAIVFFQFASGCHPFASPLIPRRIADDQADLLCEVDPSMPAPLEAVLARALGKDPNLRFQTGEEFAAALRAVIAGIEPTRSAPAVGETGDTKRSAAALGETATMRPAADKTLASKKPTKSS